MAARPRPLTQNMTYLENKFDGLVATALGSKPFNQNFLNAMAGPARMAQHVGVMILVQKRHKAAMPRLPSEVWHLMLMEFGGISAKDHQYVPIMFLPSPPPPLPSPPPPLLWDLYTTHMALYAERVADAEECRDCMKRFMHIIT